MILVEVLKNNSGKSHDIYFECWSLPLENDCENVSLTTILHHYQEHKYDVLGLRGQCLATPNIPMSRSHMVLNSDVLKFVIFRKASWPSAVRNASMIGDSESTSSSDSS